MNRVMFYCQHCVGFGHLVRSSAIVRALARDFSVMFVTGGPSVTGFELPSGIDVVRLPEIQTDAEFECLQVCDSAVSLEETQALRKELLIRAFDSFEPDAVITELYPFGRKRFAFELIPLLERSRRRKGRTAVVSSVRDVLVAKKDEGRHEARVCKIVNNITTWFWCMAISVFNGWKRHSPGSRTHSFRSRKLPARSLYQRRH